MKVNKIWLIRESKGSPKYYITGDPEFVKWFKGHRRHWGNLVWCRGLVEDNRYSYWAHLWLLKTYFVVMNHWGRRFYLPPYYEERREPIKSEIGPGLLTFTKKHTFKDTYEFDFKGTWYEDKVIQSFHNKLRFIEGVIWRDRNLLGDCSLDFGNIRDLIEPRHRLPKNPEGPYDEFRLGKPEKKTEHQPWYIKALKKIKAAL